MAATEIRLTRKTKIAKPAITAERLRETMTYNPETGEFIWLIRKGRNREFVAGTPSIDRYVTIMVDGVAYFAHRLAWLYMTGEWPRGYVDHINGTKDDNRFANLRDATGSQNQANRGPGKNNKSGHKGISFNKRQRKWVAEIQIGSFVNLEDAVEAHRRVERFVRGDFAFGSHLLEGFDAAEALGGMGGAVDQKR